MHTLLPLAASPSSSTELANGSTISGALKYRLQQQQHQQRRHQQSAMRLPVQTVVRPTLIA